MNLPDNLLPTSWYWFGHALLAALLIKTAAVAPWHRLKAMPILNLWLGAIVVLCLLWSIKAGIKPGLNFHLLGATALTLMFGPQLALLGMVLVVLAVTLAGQAGWLGFSLNALLMAALPVWVSYTFYRIVDQKLPQHFFVYIFLNAFLAAGVAMISTGLAATWLLAAAGAYTLQYLQGQYLPYYVLMAWSEALTSAMAITLMVVYRPQWVSTFDDARYLHNK